MKTYKNIILGSMLVATLTIGGTSCEDFLDREPMSNLAPEQYFSSEAQLLAYIDDEYPNILESASNWSYGPYGNDNGTDNQIEVLANDRYTSDRLRTKQEEDGNWKFERIYRCNLFIEEVKIRYGEDIDGSQNTISGDLNNIKHYIGEMYFLRAYEYFKKVKLFGDFPIIRNTLPDNAEVLKQAATRQPQNEVCRFILADLDTAAYLMNGSDKATTRINRDAALLLRSRVALYEGTWLKYFKGTAFVPGGPEWPGASQNPDYQYPSGSIDNEIEYFLNEAMTASKDVAERYKGTLTQNTGVLQQSETDPANPYYDMFASDDLSSVPEVILWRQYARNLETHNINVAAAHGNYRIGLTRGFVNSFLMLDGTPIYRHGTNADGDGYYMGDKELADVVVNRDTRLSLFLKVPGQRNCLFELDNNQGDHWVEIEPYPLITSGNAEEGYSTGYASRKGGSFNRKHYANGGGFTGVIVFRAAEALLNYMEASYENTGNLDGTAREYWQILRRRAGVSDNIDNTIAQTDMNEEAKGDWGAYSAGAILTDPILYNIRRERRSEFMCEGYRFDDLCRWRSMDQLMTAQGYQLEGFHLWNTPMEDWYDPATLVYDGSSASTVSSPEVSEYLQPFHRISNQACYDGMTWKMAHYLEPIMIKQLQLTSTTGSDPATSTIYQNPYWPTVSDQVAER